MYIYEEVHSKCCHQMLNTKPFEKIHFCFCSLIKSLYLSAAVVKGNTTVIIKAWWHWLTGTATDGPFHGSYSACRSLYGGLYLERWKHERQSLGDRLLIIWMWVNGFGKCMRWLNGEYGWLFYFIFDMQMCKFSICNLFMLFYNQSIEKPRIYD